MIAVGFFVFVLAFLALFFSGLPFLMQAPLRKRGVQVMASEVRRTSARDGKVDIQYGYLVAGGEEHTLWRRGVPEEAPGLMGVVYDSSKPKRAEFTARMPENVTRRRTYLLWLVAIAFAAVVLMVVGVVI